MVNHELESTEFPLHKEGLQELDFLIKDFDIFFIPCYNYALNIPLEYNKT